ncbi:MAG: hypothetical protein ABSB96_01060 [Gaiellaceae bacterium]
MRRGWLVLATLLAVGSLAASASPSTGGTGELRTRGYVTGISADGFRVAAATSNLAYSCDRIVVWNPVRKTITTVDTRLNCPAERPLMPVLEVTIAGNRVAWLATESGNGFYLGLNTRVLGAKKTTDVVGSDVSVTLGGYPDGDWIGNIVGHGSVLVYDRWHVCTAWPATETPFPEGCDQPASGDRKYYVFSKQELLEAVGGKSVVIASAPDVETASYKYVGRLIPPRSLAVVSIDAGRIATRDPSGEVTIYSAKGAVLEQIAVPSGHFAGTALQGSQLVTLRDDNLEVYSVSSGALVKTIPLAAGSVLRDLQSGLAVYVVGRKVHVRRLSDGKDIAYSPPGKGSVYAQIESSGLFYSYNFPGGRDHGRIAFVPYAKLLKKLG